MPEAASGSILAALLRDKPLVVTGVGSFSAAGDGVEALWQAAMAGQGLATWRDFPIGAALERFAVCGAPEPISEQPEWQKVRRLDRSAQMAWLAADQAWRQARISGAYPPARMGVMVGSSRGPVGKVGEALLRLAQPNYPPSLSATSAFASLSGVLAQHFDLHGPGAMVSATCASAAIALGLAAEQILLGKVDAMLVGGAEAPLHPSILAQLQAAGVLGDHADAAQACRPFDATRKGFVLGEGSAFLILESAHSAAARGATALARLSGWSLNQDHSGRSGVDETGASLSQVMARALALAGLAPEQVDYVNAHGTGTRLNDAAEAQALGTLFGPRASTLPCSSTKPITGHCLGATPALEAVLCVETLQRQRLLPTANCTQPDPLCPLNTRPSPVPDRRIAHVLSNSLGFWGYQAALVFSAAE